MADVTDILKGVLQDHLGRELHPSTNADQVLFEDGKTAETKIAEILEKFLSYVSKSGDSTINGSLETTDGHISADQWLAISSGSDGHALFAQNAYKDFYDNTYHYLRTHESMGARGIIFRHGSPGIYWFDTGMGATTKDTAFTPTFKRLDKPDGVLISGQDLNSLTENGYYCGQQMGNAPSVDWYYIWVNNLTDNALNYVCQIISGINQQEMYFRIRLNGNWQGWSKIFTANGGTVNGTLTISENGGNVLRLVGYDHVYVPIYKNGANSPRSGYWGYSDSATSDLTFANEVAGGAINMSAPGGLKVNGQRLPTQHYSTSAPSNSDGQDGDTWDVYV